LLISINVQAQILPHPSNAKTKQKLQACLAEAQAVAQKKLTEYMSYCSSGVMPYDSTCQHPEKTTSSVNSNLDSARTYCFQKSASGLLE
jgi:hypothetical protein